jgi:cysteine-rich repeat protein
MSATGNDTGSETTAEPSTGPSTATDTATDDTGTVNPVCGDGKVEGTEECDDGNDTPDDGCEPGCVVTAVCGNNMVETGEACDDGNTEDGDDCSADCQTVTSEVVCGDGKQEGDEQCDDGNQDAGDGCENDCTITPPECGNGKVEMGEACDDGNDVNGGANDFCKNDCSVFVPPSCQAPAEYAICDANINLADKADKTNAHKAMGICNDLPDNSVKITDFNLTSNNNAAWQVAKGFGTYKTDIDMDPNTPDELYYSPREGDTFLIVSSGVVKAPNPQGIVVENPNSQGGNGDNGNDDGNALPAPFQVAVGSNNGAGGTPFQDCDGVTFKDCSDTLQAQWTKGGSDPNDKLWFTFKTKVPAGTFGYTFDFVFCSAEWPTWVNTGFNDLLIAYQVDPAADDPNADPPVDPYSGNVTFIPDPNNMMKGLPLTITALDPYFKGPGFTNNEAPLAGTGFESNACTEWFSAKGGVQPGSTVTIGFFIADMSDSILATMAILDNFRWDCEGCIPSEVDDCGVQEPQ